MVDRRQKANSFSPFTSTSQKEMNLHSVLPKAAILIGFNLCRADQGPVSRKSWKAVSCLPCLHSRSKFQFQKILKLIHQNYQLKKQNWLFCGLGIVLLLNRFGFKICLRDRKVSCPLEKQAPKEREVEHTASHPREVRVIAILYDGDPVLRMDQNG